MDRKRLSKLNDNMDPIPIFAPRKQMTIALNNFCRYLSLTFANKYQAHVFFFRFKFSCIGQSLADLSDHGRSEI